MTACRMTMGDAARAINARLLGAADVSFEGVSTDTRQVAGGELFVALKGPNFDAHDFISQATDAGVAGVMVGHDCGVSLPQLIVPDTLKGLGQLAQHWRMGFDIPLVGVTGSNGKTTVKEMLASIFATQWNTLATRGNLNNDIGLPLTLLSLGEHHQAAIIEMGANHPGEIAYLTNIAHPTVALITNAGAAHLEGFGSIEGVAHAKGEIFQGLSSDGYAIINADDKYADVWRTLAANNRQISFGIDNEADVTCSWNGNLHGSQLAISTPMGDIECHLKLAGRHNVMNALTATAASIAAGIGLENIKRGLEAVQAVKGRMQTRRGINGASIIDDTYNANPYSLLAALKVLANCDGEKFLALGDMGELGSDTEALHQQAGRQARECGIDALYAVGNYTRKAVEAFGENGYHFEGQQALIDTLRGDLNSEVTLLVKGSRASRMENIVAAVTAD